MSGREVGSRSDREPWEEQWKGRTLMGNTIRRIHSRLAVLWVDESGMSTVEYAIGTVAAAAFGAILYSVVTGDSIVSALTNIIAKALSTNG